jgi:hypothetical protein
MTWASCQIGRDVAKAADRRRGRSRPYCDQRRRFRRAGGLYDPSDRPTWISRILEAADALRSAGRSGRYRRLSDPCTSWQSDGGSRRLHSDRPMAGRAAFRRRIRLTRITCFAPFAVCPAKGGHLQALAAKLVSSAIATTAESLKFRDRRASWCSPWHKICYCCRRTGRVLLLAIQLSSFRSGCQRRNCH